MEEKVDLIIDNQEKQMYDTSALKAAVTKLKAGDDKILAMLHSQRDTNDLNAARITELLAQLAAIPADTAALEADLNAIKDDLMAQADAIEAEVAANSATPDLPPSPVDPNAPPPAGDVNV